MGEKDKEKYACKQCGSIEFISQERSVYDVFLAEDNKLSFQTQEFNDTEELKLFCRDCGAELTFDDNDLQ